MKITMNVDCTPAEARAFFGLPDMEPVNKMITDEMAKRAKENIDTLADPKLFWEKAMTASGTGMEAMQAMMAAAMGGTSDSKKR